jgi:hypothetical protein
MLVSLKEGGDSGVERCGYAIWGFVELLVVELGCTETCVLSDGSLGRCALADVVLFLRTKWLLSDVSRSERINGGAVCVVGCLCAVGDYVVRRLTSINKGHLLIQ